MENKFHGTNCGNIFISQSSKINYQSFSLYILTNKFKDIFLEANYKNQPVKFVGCQSFVINKNVCDQYQVIKDTFGIKLVAF